ncbi:transglutaminase-like domain-containing protein [Gynurincola endophyticus]|uniref:transglutaminase-like domain-containing protein n=1 Tax=Gynurincola endophyticus TaxID=2479004 RepID=UPI000F8D9C0A|nr:transglutaminase-like domain-containing protein [Gynurincola endophyticus]
MIKKILKIFLVIILILTAFSFWMSPRLGGLIAMGKERIDQEIFFLEFDSVSTHNYHLVYENISARENLVALRKEYQLDSIVKDSKTDFEKLSKIQSWVQGRWKHDGENVPEYNDAMYILKEAEKGRRFRCVEYSIVANQCLAALGFRVRTLGLMAKDISDVKWGGGHVVNEVYLDDIKKWVFIDPQYDVITTYNGQPLNAVELQYCIANAKDFELVNPNKTITKDEYQQWVGPYLYYFTIGINGQRIGIWDRIGGNKKQLTLYPHGAEKPKYFQKLMRLNNAYYTHSTADFYPVL